jgi:hypothetical protein
MPGEHAWDPVVIDGSVVTVSNDPCPFASGEGMGQGQTHDALLDVPGQEYIRPRLPPRMR